MANPFSRVRQFFNETRAELKKANWPSSSEVKSSMVVVFIAIILLGAFVALADFSLYNVIDLCTALINGK
jgi:preprotein translocase, SecE subunit, bacterial